MDYQRYTIWSKPKSKCECRNPQALAHYLRSVKEKLDTIQELTVVGCEVKVIASSAQTPVAVALPNEWPQSALSEGLVIVPPHWDEQYSAATLSIAIPVLSYDNMLLGALVAVLDLRSLQPHLRSTTKSPPGDVLLLDPGGKVLASSYEDGRQLISLDPSVLSQLRLQLGESLVFQGMAHREVIGLAGMSAELPSHHPCRAGPCGSLWPVGKASQHVSGAGKRARRDSSRGSFSDGSLDSASAPKAYRGG